MKFFKPVKDITDLKSQYKNLCKKWHPDLNHDQDTTETMKAINSEYDELFERIITGRYTPEQAEQEIRISKAHREVIEKIISLDGLVIEICGSWVWVTGNTYQHKSILKSAKLWFAKKKCAWYWRPEDQKNRSKKRLSLEDIREKYGSNKIDNYIKAFPAK